MSIPTVSPFCIGTVRVEWGERLGSGGGEREGLLGYAVAAAAAVNEVMGASHREEVRSEK
ncbi:MAG: hypothetical protein DVB22_001575 [Verrucomicrobia bacterium]|nr:MAG: hypothetical protein DVB22_001575 [Verrucomicrobiota bacterium]